MAQVAAVLAVACAVINGLAGVAGALAWWRGAQSPGARPFWPLVRMGQAAGVALAVLTAALAATSADPDDGLFWVYALLPVAVSFVAEQLRLASAEAVLDTRGLEGSEAVRGLEEPEQRSVVLAIIQREMGVMTIAALVIGFLALRAATTTAGL